MTKKKGAERRQLGEENAEKILRMIRHQPMTVESISKKAGLNIKTAQRHITHLYGTQQIHIADWEPTRSRPRRMYLAGRDIDIESPDAPAERKRDDSSAFTAWHLDLMCRVGQTEEAI